MGNTENFSQFRRQSKKGILVIYLNILYKVLKAFWVLLFLFIQKFSKISDEVLLYIYLGVGGLLLFFLVRAFLIFKNFKFKIENQHFILKKGIIKKTNTSIPFDRIQNINFKQNIIQQIINVHEVNLETAGSSKAEISIKALSFKEASALKQAITIFNNNVTESEIDTKVVEKPLLKVDFLALMKVSITENHLQSLLLLFAILVGFYQQIDELVKGLGKREQLKDFISNNTSALETSVILIIGLLISLTVVAVLSSVVRVVLRHFNLTVFVKNSALEIYQGLTTKKSVILKKDKVQHITISHNPIKKWLGISFITFKQAISGKVKKKQDKIIKIVGCNKEQVTAIKTLLFPGEILEGINKNYSHSYFKYRMYVRSVFFFVALNIGLYFVVENNYVFLVNIILVLLFIFIIELKFRKRYYLFNEELLLVGQGIVETHKTFLPFFKVQNIELKQTIFQVRKNVADLVFQTASGKIKLPCIPLEKAQKIYNYTLFKVETSKKSWM
ncbi:PH domain-containing protein [Polaribacter sp. PL03]|uniref:PH domain-containing protein n=1 Tax=Polaribacter sp. PL03 TaxID=3088353 RepID=UPI0029D37B11|nr:PH domain-containing protein [Polaribacter sp. PL03]MDX6747793.1 PH domain-containing protein [Polaribacter sp. PL03]